MTGIVVVLIGLLAAGTAVRYLLPRAPAWLPMTGASLWLAVLGLERFRLAHRPDSSLLPASYESSFRY